MNSQLFRASLFVAALLALPTLASDLKNVNEIVAKTNLGAFYAGKDISAQARMKITDNQGRVQIRQFNVLRKDIEDGGDQQFLISFSRPSDVKGMTFRVEKHVNTNDDRWLYLPALDLVKRISSSDKRTSFVGSNFYYEDISGRNITLDKFELVNTTPTSYILKATPIDPMSVEFSHYTVTIDKQMMLPMSIIYTDKRGNEYRKIEALKVVNIDGFNTVTSSKVTDLANNASTLMQFRGIKYDNNIPGSVFSERSLRNPPKKWFK